MKSFIKIGLIISFLLFLLCHGAYAQTRYQVDPVDPTYFNHPTLIPTIDESYLPEEHIAVFNDQIRIVHDGTIDVTESITYDFGNIPRHGIYRFIPTIKTNKQGKKYALTISNISVTDKEGRPYTFVKTNSDDTLQLKIGDANNTITGLHTYIISYSVSGALTYFSDHDELYWNSTGDKWTVPIAHSTTVIDIEGGTPVGTTTICYTGSAGSTASNCSVETVQGQGAQVASNGILEPGEGLTVVFGFKKGLVQVLEPKEVINFYDTPIGKVLKTLMAIGFALISLLWNLVYPVWIVIKWFIKGRDPKPLVGEVTAWYDPPKNKVGRFITPSEAGSLVDEKVDTRDIFALVVDLARRGYLTIHAEDKKETVLEKKKYPDAEVLPYEKAFLLELFKGKEMVNLKNTRLTTLMTNTKNDLYDLLVENGYFEKNPEDTRNFYTLIMVVALFTFNMPLTIAALLFGKNIPSKTQLGSDAAAIARSLKNFLSSQERQLKFQAEKQYFFEKLLPYAVAFGIESVWISRLVEMGAQQPDWFVTEPGYVFTATAFSNSLTSSYSGLSSALSPTTSSSGFSSGASGGFSGGGGGGGGGGSW